MSEVPIPLVFRDPLQPLQLSSFRDQLIRQEETIIFALIERAQFPRNEVIYKKGAKQVLGDGKSIGDDLSFLEYLLIETEKVHAKVRRYTSPDENAFFPDRLGPPLLPLLDFPPVIRPNNINYNDRVMNCYLTKILSAITVDGDNHQTYGSSAVSDISALQALSKRIHFGKYIAEAKFQSAKEKYTALILSNDAEGLMRELTDSVVEEKVLNRVAIKASTYGHDPTDANNSNLSYKVDPSIIRDIYYKVVIPLTKDVQVQYLLQRLQHTTVGCLELSDPVYKAALHHFGQESSENISTFTNAKELVSNMMSNGVAYAMLPLEHSTNSLYPETRDLIRSTGARICDEIYVKVDDSEVRMVILGKVLSTPTGKDKTTLFFGVHNKAGALRQVLDIFTNHSVNLCNIQSLPGGEPFLYDFYVDLEGHTNDSNIATALEEIKKISTFIQIAGSYPNRDLGRKRKREQ